ncbi:MAG: beta-galactosidase [Candidatus Omnitrophica bacterium]|nr:beta-galactosidase [Candidatus Omnitrophota bacterium]
MTISILSRKATIKIVCAVVFLFTLAAMPLNLFAEDEDIQNPFGVLEFLHWNHDWNNYKYSSAEDLEKALILMRQAGVGWVRMDFLWDEIEPQKGQFDFKKYDCLAELIAKHKIKILGILDYSATWAAACAEWNCPPKDNQLFVDYAAKTIEHYKGKVDYWEIWNEPDSGAYWSQQDGLKKYCDLLKCVYIAAKKVNPDCKILNGGLANGLASVNRLYDNGAKDYFDILNIHIFESPVHKKSIKGLIAYPKLAYKVMSRNGDGHKRIWITETGCPGVKRWCKVDNWWLGKNPTERQQAAWVKEVYDNLLKDPNVEKIFWAFFRDTKGHWDTGVDYFGLVRWDFSKKPSYKAYKECYDRWKRSKR